MNRYTATVLPVLLVAVLAACTASGGSLGTVAPGSPSPEPTLPQGSPDLTPEPSAGPTGSPGSSPTPAPTGTTIVRAYFWLDGPEGSAGLVPVLREVPKTSAVARAAMNALLEAPNEKERANGISSAVPDGTELVGISIESGIATVDLSQDFESGGGSASTMVRLGQVVYTLTQFPTVRGVDFQIEGRRVDVFGSEGIVLDGPQARDDYEDLLPAIFVDRPAWGAALGNPGRVTGNANVFEAAFKIALLDGSGRTLVDEQVMATCGTGCRGTFDVTLRYTVGRAQWGTLRAYNLSAADGSVEDARDYPVWLTPAG